MSTGYVRDADVPHGGSAWPGLLEASDEEIADAVAFADPMVLRGWLYQLTGDEAVREMDLKKVSGERAQYAVPGIADPAQIGTLRAKAVALLKAYRDGGGGEVDGGPVKRLQISLGLIAGVPIPDAELEQWLEELAVDPWARELKWHEPPRPEVLEEFSVLVIGTGMGGLNAAVQLKRAGIKFTVVEKNAGVGGTWYENRYPGARLDTESRSYTHIFGAGFPYSSRYNEWPENASYFNWVADTFGLRGDIVFGAEVTSLVWDENASVWVVTTEGPEGREVRRVNAVISGVGFLNRPHVPEFAGADEFAGQSWHTARWPDGAELRGKSVAVIGTGCTGYQLIPELALEAEHIYVFQRTPQWLFPVAGYRSPFPEQVRWLDRNVPYYTNFARFRAFCNTVYSLGSLNDVDPEFNDPYSPNAIIKERRDACIEFLERKFESRPELVEKMIPPHPVFSARPVVVDTEYSIADALVRDNVTLITDGIKTMNRKGIESAAGDQYDVDVIVYATGFKANDYLWPMEVRGRGGQRVEELWDGTGPQAYQGTMLPGFPNFWMLYGPNTNGGISVAAFHEITTRYALECMERLILDGGKGSIEVTRDAYLRYNEELDRRNETKVWNDPRSTSYWGVNKFGRNSNRCPFRGTELWRFLRYPDYGDLIVEP